MKNIQSTKTRDGEYPSYAIASVWGILVGLTKDDALRRWSEMRGHGLLYGRREDGFYEVIDHK